MSSPITRGFLELGALHLFWCCSALGKVSEIETIENWSLKICHLSCKQCRHDTARTLRAMTNDKSPMTNSQSRSSKSWSLPSPTGLAQKSEMQLSGALGRGPRLFHFDWKTYCQRNQRQGNGKRRN
jgi:hypothetical protein